MSLKFSFTSSLLLKFRGKTRLKTQISLLKIYKIIHDRSLSFLGTETSIKSDEVKLNLRLKSLLQTYKIIHDRSLSYLGTETSIKSDEVKLNLRLKYLLLQTHKIIHDRSLSYLGTETSIKNDEVKLILRLKSPSYRHTK